MSSTSRVWKAFDKAFEEADKAFAEADKAFKHSYEKKTGLRVDVTTRRVRFYGRWKPFWYFLKRAFEVNAPGDSLRGGLNDVEAMKTQYFTLPVTALPAAVPGQLVFPCRDKCCGFVHRVADGQAHIVMFWPMEVTRGMRAADALLLKEKLTDEELTDFITRTEYLCPGFERMLLTPR